jgi:hypothetical protein
MFRDSALITQWLIGAAQVNYLNSNGTPCYTPVVGLCGSNVAFRQTQLALPAKISQLHGKNRNQKAETHRIVSYTTKYVKFTSGNAMVPSRISGLRT